MCCRGLRRKFRDAFYVSLFLAVNQGSVIQTRECQVMMPRAMGVIETCGMPSALVIADIMGKAADVEILGFENTDAGRVSILIRGATGAVQAAIAAAIHQPVNYPGLLGHHILPCPDESVELTTLLRGHPQTWQSDVEWLDD